jgi:methyl coenzyme M reductase gamma subunit
LQGSALFDRALTGCFRKRGAGHKLRQNNLAGFEMLHRNIEARANRIFIQRDAIGRSAAESPVPLITG